MTITMRNYGQPGDFSLVSKFLVDHYQPDNRDGNWLQPAWEYMHTHPMLDPTALGRIGIWEDSGDVVAVVHYESSLGEAFFQLDPSYTHLKPDLLSYAEKWLVGETESGDRLLRVYINDFDSEFIQLVQSRGYAHEPNYDRPMSQYHIPEPFPVITLPEDFRLKSLQEENDLNKIHRVMWRGFNHPGEPPADEVHDRAQMQSGPNFRKDLNIIVEAPNRDYVVYAGTWQEPINQYAYVEPVATDPEYRRRGLGKAAVLEGIRRCASLGATVAYVGSDLPFYLALGFKKIHTAQSWRVPS